MTRMSISALAGVLALTATQTVTAQCELVSMAEAESLLGADTTDMTGDDAEFQCLFLSNESGIMLIVQFADREYFENATLLQPFETVDIGNAGRSRVEANGTASVQFLQGNASATMTVRPTRGGTHDFLDSLLQLATRVAARME